MSKLPILMYHNISSNLDLSRGLTLASQKFEKQLQYLVKHNFTTYFISELDNKNSISSKSVVLTFDDVTENQLLYALPLLKKYNIKATFFVPFSFIGSSDSWNLGSEKIMTIEQLKSLDPDCVELGHHSFSHKKYSELNKNEIQDDFDKSFEFISKNDLKVFPALAYPYGNYPKKENQKKDFFQLLEKNKIKMALRIGNRVNHFPFKNKYEIQRIDIKGEDNLFVFKWKLRIGKLRLF
ncbi:polysaccharide deacetylase family protein [Flavobacterium sp.]|uniref:polysaccharide deacetylase family protein n=1 Tax=Flavobacterium sp. TaxID=239 RepID=UPI0038FD368C